MSDLEYYSQLIDGIFGARTTTFDINANTTNNVIGALNHTTDYSQFKTNFRARLNRLKTIYSTEPTYLREILVQVNEVASAKNWEGAFAELAAFDHLNQDILRHRTYLATPIKPNVTLNKSETFAFELGKAAANLDGFIEDRPLYFDIKTFKDNVREILEGIYSQLERDFGRSDFKIATEHSLDISYDDFQANRNNLYSELKSSITPSVNFLRSRVIPNLTFRIMWGAGIQFAEHTYSPFRHAENYYKTIFNYADKFVKNYSSVIVLVVFPWYNNVVKDFRNENVKFYRSLARRVFMQYKNDATLFNTFASNFSGSHSIYQVSNNLSGIIFLEDNTILSNDPDQTNVRSFVYLNPNANHKVIDSLASDYVIGLRNTEYDNFEHDSY